MKNRMALYFAAGHRFNYALAHRQLGLVHRDRGATGDAIRAFRRSIEVFASLPADQRDPKQSLTTTADLGLASMP